MLPIATQHVRAKAPFKECELELLNRHTGKMGDTLVDVPPVAITNSRDLQIEGKPVLPDGRFKPRAAPPYSIFSHQPGGALGWMRCRLSRRIST